MTNSEQKLDLIIAQLSRLNDIAEAFAKAWSIRTHAVQQWAMDAAEMTRTSRAVNRHDEESSDFPTSTVSSKEAFFKRKDQP